MNQARFSKGLQARGRVSISILALTLFTANSAAQVPAQGSPDADAKATELSVTGKQAFDAKQYDEAYDAFRQVWAAKKNVTTAANLAMVELKLGKMRDAAEHFQFALRHFPTTPDAEKSRALVQKRLDETKARIGTLVLHVNVAGAQVHVDGVLLGTAPLDEVFLDPGQRILEVSHPGHKPVRKVLTFAAGSTEQVRLTLEPLAPTKERAQSGSPTAPPPQPPPGGSKIPWSYIAIGAGGVSGVALLLTGTAFTVWSDDTAEAADRVLARIDKAGGEKTCSMPGPNAEDCKQLDSLRAEQRRTAHVAIGTLVAGGAVTAATVVFYAVLALKQPRSPAVQALPAAGPHTAGLVVRGQW